MSREQRNADFCEAQTDAQMAYIEAEREVDRLQAENTRLRSCLSDDEKNARLILGENRDLRELVRDMMRFFEDEDWCTICDQTCKCEAQEQYEEDCLMRAVFHDRMRKLGVEVD